MQETKHTKAIEEGRKALAETRAYVRRHAPYISKILYGLVPYFIPGFGTLAVTDRMVLIIDPLVFNPWPINVRGGAVFHECMHVAHGHAARSARVKKIKELMTNVDIAPIALDLPINSEIRRVEHEQIFDGSRQKIRTWDLPDWACYPEKFGLPEGLTAEQYYHLLLKEENKKKVEKHLEQGCGKGDGKDKSKKGDSGGQGGAGNKNGKPGVGGGGCGSCVGSPVDVGVEAAANAAVGRTKADSERIRRGAVTDIKEAKRKGGPGCGSMPSSLENLLEFDGTETSIVPWRQKLGRVTRRATGRVQAGRSDYSLSHPAKRSMVRSIIRPGLIDRKLVILFIEDSSGSMGNDQLKAVRIEAGSVMSSLGIEEALFIDADAAVASEPRRIRLRDLKTLPVKGGGGTNFIPGIELAQRMKPRPDIIMYLTDGDGPAPLHAPKGIEVVWCIVPSQHCNRRPANWGHLVICSDNPDEQELAEPYERTA